MPASARARLRSLPRRAPAPKRAGGPGGIRRAWICLLFRSLRSRMDGQIGQRVHALVDLLDGVVEVRRDAHARAARRHADAAARELPARRVAVDAAEYEDAGALRGRRDQVESV